MEQREREQRLMDLPKGYISHKVIHGKDYYYQQWKEEGKLLSRYLRDDEVEPLRALLEERKTLLAEEKEEKKKERLQSRLTAWQKNLKSYLSYPVGIGIQDFEKMMDWGAFYVDKTEFLRVWWETTDEVTLITRPRRFGKTLTLSMVECFFSVRYAGREDLFRNLSVWKYPDMRKLQGTLPVIFVSFASVKMDQADSALRQLQIAVSDAFLRNEYLWQDDRLTGEEREVLRTLYRTLYNGTAAEQMIYALSRLSAAMYHYHGVKPLILLDEYDTPLLEAYLNGCWNEVLSWMRSFFNASFKTNSYLGKALLTGITRVGKESLFSDLNNLFVDSPLQAYYADYFGFTEEEVFKAMDCQKLGSIEEKKLVKKWYDGYQFGTGREIYNPWSVTNYLRLKKVKPYWVNSSSNELLLRLFAKMDAEGKRILEDLMNGKCFSSPVAEEISFRFLEQDMQNIWSLMIYSGYLKAEIQTEETDRTIYRLSAVNLEVRTCLKQLMSSVFSRSSGDYNRFLEALLARNLEEMNAYLSWTAETIFSYFDTGRREKDSESFYHGFVLALLTDLDDRYLVRSNRESGFGRYDLMLIPRELSGGLYAYILEFKVHNPRLEKNLEETARRALEQIDQKHYRTDLLSMGIRPDRIVCYGFAFHGKELLILE